MGKFKGLPSQTIRLPGQTLGKTTEIKGYWETPQFTEERRLQSLSIDRLQSLSIDRLQSLSIDRLQSLSIDRLQSLSIDRLQSLSGSFSRKKYPPQKKLLG
jgi:hypothetical protein